jgi:hypothetical protein
MGLKKKISARAMRRTFQCCGAGWLMAMGAGSEMRIARRERGLSLA